MKNKNNNKNQCSNLHANSTRVKLLHVKASLETSLCFIGGESSRLIVGLLWIWVQRKISGFQQDTVLKTVNFSLIKEKHWGGDFRKEHGCRRGSHVRKEKKILPARQVYTLTICHVCIGLKTKLLKLISLLICNSFCLALSLTQVVSR